MGKSLDQWIAEAGDGSQIGTTLVTNQDNGIVGYAEGSLTYRPAELTGLFFRPARLSNTGGTPLKFYFNDRKLDIDPPGPGPFGHSPRQPFSADATDNLGLSINLGPIGGRVARFTLLSWGNARFSVSLEARGNLLIGNGPPIGNLTDTALYVLSFTGVFNPPH